MTEIDTLILFSITSIIFVGVLIFFISRKAKRLKGLSEKERQKEVEKYNNRSDVALFIKGIMEMFAK